MLRVIDYSAYPGMNNAIRHILSLEVRRSGRDGSWQAFVCAGVVLLPLALASLPASAMIASGACALAALATRLLDPFGVRDRDPWKFATLPLSTRDLLLAKFIFHVLGGAALMIVSCACYCWWIPEIPDTGDLSRGGLFFVSGLVSIEIVGLAFLPERLLDDRTSLPETVIVILLSLLVGFFALGAPLLLYWLAGSSLALIVYVIMLLLSWYHLALPAGIRRMRSLLDGHESP